MGQEMSVLFVGIGTTAVCHYRCALPARALGEDWVGVDDDFHMLTGQVGGKSQLPNVEDYDVVVCQQPAGPKWEERIARMRKLGIRVLYETDDYLHGIGKQDDHVHQNYFTRRTLKAYDRCMAACDGVIVSTRFLAERYRKINPNIFICPNGIDPERYDFERPTRDYVTVGWAGATGHTSALLDWLNGGITAVLLSHPSTRFVAIGEPAVATHVANDLGEGRVTAVPWASMENYPSALAGVDIALAPAHNTPWFRGKSDLRWLEASALGIPIICQPHLYPEAELKASDAEEASAVLAHLLTCPDELPAIGARAREHVLRARSMPSAVEPWRAALY